MIDLYGIETSSYFNLVNALDEIGLTFTAHTDPDELVDKGFKSLPVLVVDGKELTYKKATQWLKRKKR